MTATSTSPKTSPADGAARRPHTGMGDPNCPVCHGVGYVSDDFPVGHPQFGKVRLCTCQLENAQLQRAAELRADSNTETLVGKTFDNFLAEGVSPDPSIRLTLHAAYDLCRAFAAHPEKEKWLLLNGAYGCGKTHLAAAIANECLRNGKPVLFLNVPDLLDYLRAAFAPTSEESYSDRFDEIRTAPILILDDLGTESPTAWAVEKLYQIINYRYNARLPTVITTNRDLKDIDQRIASRLGDIDMVTPLTILAPDFRAGKLNPTSDVSTLTIHRGQTFESFDTRTDLTGEARQTFLEAIRAAREYAEEPRGWLVFAGSYGAGKTHLAAAMANHRAQTGKPVIFVTFQDLSELFRSGPTREAEERNGKLLQQVKTTEFLVIDDLPSLAGTTGYYRERFFQIFNYRFDAGLPTVFTTSAEEKDLDLRIKSRIYSEHAQLYLLKVSPYRGKKKTARKSAR